MSSPDIRNVDSEFRFGKIQRMRDPYWPKIGYAFPESPSDVDDWATQIFNASNFLELFEDND